MIIMIIMTIIITHIFFKFEKKNVYTRQLCVGLIFVFVIVVTYERYYVTSVTSVVL